MTSRPTPPRLGFRVPAPPSPRDPATEGDDDGGLRAGDLLDGRYQVEERIGEGGVGVVYRALQLKLHRRVAIKLLQQTDDEQRPRFEREAVTLSALFHPNIVSVQDYGHTRGKPFLVMELLEGRTLRELVDTEGALGVPRALALTRQVLHALAYAHELGLVHRDLKPANLIVQALPSHEHVKVLDFGFVKLLPGSYLDRGVQLSRVGFTFGTPAYMSPEHATGGEVDGRSDLYSLGILLFEMLTGTKPFEGELPELIRHHLSTKVPLLAERRPELSGLTGLQALVERALAKPRDDRFASAAEFLQALDALKLSVPSEARAAEVALQAAGALSLPTSAPGLDVELERLASAVQQFARRAFTRLREQGGPALTRASATSRAHAERAAVELRTRALSFWAWATPRLKRAQAELARLVQQLQARMNGKVGEAAAGARVEVPEAQPPASAETAHAATLALDDNAQAVAAPAAEDSKPRVVD